MIEQNRLRQQWLEQDEAEIDAAIGALLQHAGGRRLLWWLLRVGKIGTQPFGGNALQTAFACGELNVGNQILDRITSVSPEGYVNMMKEQADEHRTRTDALANAGANTDPYAGTDSDT